MFRSFETTMAYHQDRARVAAQRSALLRQDLSDEAAASRPHGRLSALLRRLAGSPASA